MRTIEIKTTQNVTITYELAAASDRIIAFIIDGLAKLLCAIAALWFFSMMPSSFSEEIGILFMYFFYVPLFMTPMLIMESTMNGQTLGKRIMRIKVIKLDGRQPVFYDYLLRWCFRIVDIYGTLGISGSVMIASTEYAQRIGDMVSNTTVIRVTDRMKITLKDVLKIDTRMSYEPQYPAVRSFRETDIMLVKAAVERYLKYRNESHRIALEDIKVRMCEKLGIDQMEGDTVLFLRTLIKDYIVLTR